MAMNPHHDDVQEAEMLAGEFEVRLARIRSDGPTAQTVNDEHLAWVGLRDSIALALTARRAKEAAPQVHCDCELHDSCLICKPTPPADIGSRIAEQIMRIGRSGRLAKRLVLHDENDRSLMAGWSQQPLADFINSALAEAPPVTMPTREQVLHTILYENPTMTHQKGEYTTDAILALFAEAQGRKA